MNLKAKFSIQTKDGIIRHLIAQDECIQQILRGEEPTKIGLLTSLPFCVYCKNDNVISVILLLITSPMSFTSFIHSFNIHFPQKDTDAQADL